MVLWKAIVVNSLVDLQVVQNLSDCGVFFVKFPFSGAPFSFLGFFCSLGILKERYAAGLLEAINRISEG